MVRHIIRKTLRGTSAARGASCEQCPEVPALAEQLGAFPVMSSTMWTAAEIGVSCCRVCGDLKQLCCNLPEELRE